MMGKRKRKNFEGFKSTQSFEKIPEGCHHYDNVTEVPWDIQKYTVVLLTAHPFLTVLGIFISATVYFPNMTKEYG